MSVSSVKGAFWPFLRNRSIPLAFFVDCRVSDY
jgi:hypothetical protein